MKIKHSKPLNHIFYWGFSLALLIIVFGHSWNSNLHAFYFVSMLFPVVLGTSYFFNYFLVPRYLLKNKPFLFALYLFYTLIISLYLELLVLLFSLSYLANFSMTRIPPNASNILLLTALMYLLVILGSFLVMMEQWKVSQNEIKALKSQQAKNNRSYLEVKSQRKSIQIPFDKILYIESLGDYVYFITTGKKIKSKEGISKLQLRLPDQFVRIHRSFIVNINSTSCINAKEVLINEISLPIGRSYKKQIQSIISVI